MAVRPPCDVGVVLGARAPHRSIGVGTWVLAVAILGSTMVFIDSTVVNIALPVIQADLHAGIGDMQWVVNAYALFLSALMIVGGSLGDLFGRKRIFIIGTIIFAAASAWCGLAPNASHLILARGVQGMGAALLTPGSLALISANFDESRRGRAIGIWSAVTAVMTAVGPPLGGWIVQYASWRWIFFINPLIAIVVVALAVFGGVPESRDDAAPRHIDYTAAFLTTLGLGALTYGLISADTLGLGNPIVIGSLIVGLFALVLCLFVEARTPEPMIPLHLFSSRTFSGANLLTFLLYGALGGALFFVPFDLIQVQHYPPSAAGLAMLPFIIFMVTLSPWAGGLVPRYGAKLPLVVGPLIAACGFALFALPGIGGSYWTTFFPAFAVFGLGMAITVTPLTTTVLGAVPAEHAGLASAINNAVSRASGLFAVAILSLVVLSVFGTRFDASLAAIHAPPHVVAEMAPERSKLAAAQVPADVPQPLHGEISDAIAWSYVAGLRYAMLIAALLAVASAVIAALMIDGKPKKESLAQEPGTTR